MGCLADVGAAEGAEDVVDRADVGADVVDCAESVLDSADDVVDVDVAVIGAGPAGSSAAIWARRAGFEVVLIDRAQTGRDKCCGDGLTALALRELEALALRPNSLRSWMPIETAYVRTPRGREVRLPLPQHRGHFAAVCRRSELDAALVALATEAGADVRCGVAFEQFDDTAEHGRTATVRLDDASAIRARFVIAADGVYSPVRKALGLGPQRYRGDWHALRGYLTADGPASRELWVWFEPDLLPGYAWSFPLSDGRVNVGFGVPRTPRSNAATGLTTTGHRTTGRTIAGTASSLSGKRLAEIWAGLTERPHIREVLGDHSLDGPVRAWPIPARLGGLDFASGRTLLCGDAAAAADPLTGEGIGQALAMGRMAIEAIKRGGPPDSVAARYRRELRAEFSLDHRLARSLSNVLSHERLAETSLAAVDLSPWTRRQFARWMFEDYPRAAVATPRRWHRGITSPRGAYRPDCTPADSVAVAPEGTKSPS